MSILKFFKKKTKKDQASLKTDLGILVFHNTSEVIRAENILKEKGWKVRVMGPPPEIRSGCDLVIEFPLIEELNILRILEEKGITPMDVVPENSPLLKPVDLFNVKDYGKFLMVRAANMKLTVEKDTLIIVNISGGGCPDVPYLAQRLIGKSIKEVPEPRELGHTLCGYALQLAFEEMKRRCLP